MSSSESAGAAFSTRGSGRWLRILERFGLARDGRPRFGRVALASVAVTYLPLVALSAAAGLAWGSRVEIPLLRDFVPHGRFLLAVPLLILAEPVVARRLARVSAELMRASLLEPDDARRMSAALARAARLWSARGATVAFLVASVALAPELYRADAQGDWQSAHGRLTPGGAWYLSVSVPLLRFLVLRWLWRFALWSWVLWRFSRLRFRISAIHPDRVGGLGFLGETQEGFSIPIGALSIQISCLIANEVLHRGADLSAYGSPLALYVSMAILLLFAPLLVFAPKLVEAKDAALFALSRIGSRGADGLMQRLARDSEEWPSEAISGVSDFSLLYDTARRMRALPAELRHVVVMLAVTTLPFAPLVLLKLPAREVLRIVAGILM